MVGGLIWQGCGRKVTTTNPTPPVLADRNKKLQGSLAYVFGSENTFVEHATQSKSLAVDLVDQFVAFFRESN